MLKKLFEKLLCCHDYEEIHKVRIYDRENAAMPICGKILYRCRKCGKFKKIRI